MSEHPTQAVSPGAGPGAGRAHPGSRTWSTRSGRPRPSSRATTRPPPPRDDLMAGRIPDAVVIGAGPNGLVAANVLADAGWDVLVLEQQPKPGGAVASDSDVADGFVHDTFSSFYPLAAASPAITSLGLENFGLTWSHAPAVVGTPAADGGWALLYRDVERTAAALDRLWPGDGDAWRELSAGWDTLGPALTQALLTPFPPLRGAARAALAAPKAGVRPLTTLIRSARSLSADLHSEAARMLIVGNAAHADLSPDGAGSGLIGWLLAMLGQTVGFPVPRGGAGRLATALADRFTAAGGEIRCETTVSAIEVEHGRAVGVRAGEELIRCRRAVIADVSAPALYGELLDPAAVPARVHRRLRLFEWDPGTVKVDWGIVRAGALVRPPGRCARHRPPGCLGHRGLRVDGSSHRAGGPGRPLPAGRSDDRRRPLPFPRRHRGAVGVHPCPATRSIGRAGKDQWPLGCRRGPGDGRPDAVPDRAPRPRPGHPDHRPPGARSARVAATQRQSARRRTGWRDLGVAPAIGAAPHSRPGSGRDLRARCLSRLRVSSPGRRRTRGRRRQRGPGGAAARPVGSVASGLSGWTI